MLSKVKQTVILTGSSGYVGNLVREKLVGAGVTVIEIDIHNPLNPVDLANEGQLSKLNLPENYLLVHLAFPLPGKLRSKYFVNLIRKINANITQRFRPDRTLLISSTAVYPLKYLSGGDPTPWEVYGELKLESEKVFQNNFDNLTIYRPGTLVEQTRESSMMKFMSQLSKSRFPLMPGDGNLTHPFTHTHDLVDAISSWVTDINAPQGAFDLTAQNPLTMNEMKNLGRTKKVCFTVRMPIILLSKIGSDNYPALGISKWHFRALCYDYKQELKNPYQSGFKSYKDLLRF